MDEQPISVETVKKYIRRQHGIAIARMRLQAEQANYNADLLEEFLSRGLSADEWSIDASGKMTKKARESLVSAEA